MSTTILTIEGVTLRRTGWTTDARRCPMQGGSLELCFDETDYSEWAGADQVPYNHDDNRIRWRCEKCVGYWLENFFLEEPGRSLPPGGIILACPNCAGFRLRAECYPSCCRLHSCMDCGAGFELVAEVVEVGSPQEPPADARRRADLLLADSELVDPAHCSGWVRPFRRCPKHNVPLELVFIPPLFRQPPTLLAWRCDACQWSWAEANFRHLRPLFSSETSAAVDCPVCGYELVSSTDANGSAICRICHSKLRLRLEPLPL